MVREKQILEFAPDKMPIGKHDRDNTSFTQHSIDLQKGDVIYTLTDGMPDQFGLSAEARAKAEAKINNESSTLEEINFAKASLLKGKKFMYRPL